MSANNDKLRLNINRNSQILYGYNQAINDDELGIFLSKITNSDFNPNLHLDIDLRSNRLTAAGIDYLMMRVDGLKVPSISIKLEDNQLGIAGAKKLAWKIRRLQLPIKDLNISRNHIQSKGALSIIKAIRSICLLRLKLNENSIDTQGAIEIAEELKSNEHLKDLSLTNNKIGDHGAKALAFMLRDNRTLQSLNLWCNFLNSMSAAYFSEVLSKVGQAKLNHKDSNINETLLSLDLGGNNIANPIAMKLIDKALEMNKQSTFAAYNRCFFSQIDYIPSTNWESSNVMRP